MKEPLILEIKTNSLDDGPGIRTVVFFKGCPLSCVWCQNPESRKPGPELSWDAGECIGCGTCAELCPEGAVGPDNRFFVDRGLCSLCYECVERCPAEALQRAGRQYGISEIIEIIKKDIPFYKTSGGGVTLSGGEATMFMEYSSALLEEIRKLDVHVILETCGLFDYGKFMSSMYGGLDEIYYDLKLLDAGEHRQYCGVKNETILDNFKKLFAKAREGGVPVLPRVPLIPGITATEHNLKSIASFLERIGVKEVALLEYNPLWIDKCAMLGIEKPELPTEWMDREKIEEIKEIFRDRGAHPRE